MTKTGLVLSGGGAKGAYHIGMMHALLEMNVGIDMISGASIGALNGGVLASAPDLKIGVERLERVWQRLGETSPLKLRDTGELLGGVKKLLPYLTFLSSAGLRANPYFLGLNGLWVLLNKTPIGNKLLDIKDSLPEFLRKLVSDNEFKSLLTDVPLQEMMDEFLDVEQLQRSLPLYVAVFKQESILKGGLDIAKAELLGIENSDSLFKHIQSLPIEQQKDMLLASAAIPILFESRKDLDGSSLTDGGQGGWIKAQGNTPVAPLIEAGCNHIIVSHLNNGSLWHCYDFPKTTCIEIRPNPKLDLGLSAMFDFSPEKIEQLKNAGYEDTKDQLGKMKQALDTLSDKRSVMNQLDSVVEDNVSSEKLNQAMVKLRQAK